MQKVVMKIGSQWSGKFGEKLCKKQSARDSDKGKERENLGSAAVAASPFRTSGRPGATQAQRPPPGPEAARLAPQSVQCVRPAAADDGAREHGDGAAAAAQAPPVRTGGGGAAAAVGAARRPHQDPPAGRLRHGLLRRPARHAAVRLLLPGGARVLLAVLSRGRRRLAHGPRRRPPHPAPHRRRRSSRYACRPCPHSSGPRLLCCFHIFYS